MLKKTLVPIVLSVLSGMAAGETHCTADETVYFSCQIKDTSDVVSLCGSPLIDSTTRTKSKSEWLQYRFGKLGGMSVFRYPAKKTNSKRRFKSEAHSYLGEGNARSYIDRVWFKNKDATYGVIADQGDHSFSGVIALVGNQTTEFPCAIGIDSGSYVTGNDFSSLVRSLTRIE